MFSIFFMEKNNDSIAWSFWGGIGGSALSNTLGYDYTSWRLLILESENKWQITPFHLSGSTLRHVSFLLIKTTFISLQESYWKFKVKYLKNEAFAT